MEIYLKKKQFELLRKYGDVDLYHDNLREENNKILIIGNKQYFENLLDKISDVFIELGLNNNDEPNKIGLQIEEIIDVLSKVIYD
ncbi:MAG: hypothetical protein N4A49_01225 [Marinifilaceae bacterium]|jgi:ribosome assembly protein YihI (activator of Der GTPase)|nr:hypothetical protein [Marinifilaceae bacterium]